MGEVYRARDLRLGREIALKVLPAGMGGNPDRLARFEREARTVAGLNHPNIVTLFSVEDEGDVRFLTMELVEGQSLDHALLAGGLAIARVIELGIALADALAAAHEKGVVHRDLKPANVMLTKDGRVKVLDFGLAKLAASESDPDLSMAATRATPLSSDGLLVGTVPYMAPEQIRGEAVDVRSDLFSLGVVLYELASGRRPFTGETHVDISHAILREAPRPLASVRAGLPVELGRLVMHCLEKSPRERAQSALDLSNELRRLRRELERSETGLAVKPPLDKVASIAVRPFVNRSASTDDEYFSDGLADELLNVLAKIKGLRVIARSSSFTFKGRQVTAAEIGKALDVATVLEGSVRKAGNRVRISVQLVNIADSSHLWSETYDRTLDDIFAVQDDIAHSVVRELRTTLLGKTDDSDLSGEAKADVAHAARGRATDPEAHRLLLLARHRLGQISREDTTRAIAHLNEAVARDPEFALAWNELARAFAIEADRSWVPVAEGYARVREALQRALSLEPHLADAHVTSGRFLLTYEWNWKGAQAAASRALELEPRNSRALRLAADLSTCRGDLEHALATYQRSIEGDPLSAATYNNLGLALFFGGRLAEAEEAYRRAVELAPRSSVGLAFRAINLAALGRGEEALAEASHAADAWFRLYALAIVHQALGHSDEAEAALRELIDQHAEQSASQIAEVEAVFGRTDAAFEWLERAYESRDGGLVFAGVLPHLRPLHDDPRWTVFLRRMGLDG